MVLYYFFQIGILQNFKGQISLKTKVIMEDDWSKFNLIQFKSNAVTAYNK